MCGILASTLLPGNDHNTNNVDKAFLAPILFVSKATKKKVT